MKLNKKMEEKGFIDQYLEVIGTNTLYGFQYSFGIQPQHCILCWCNSDMSKETFQRIKELSGAQSLVHDDYLGRGYLQVHVSDYEKFPIIFNSILQCGEWFRTRNSADVCFKPGETFTVIKMEEKLIKSLSDYLVEYPHFIEMDSIFTWRHFKYWSYITDEGRSFCRHIRRLKRKKEYHVKDAMNPFKWEKFRNVRFRESYLEIPKDSPLGLPAPAAREVPPECLICMEKPANTQVFPCGCVVCCSDCSNGLKVTNDAKTCVKCRRKINKIENVY